jgi:hypothetical protein
MEGDTMSPFGDKIRLVSQVAAWRTVARQSGISEMHGN